MQTLHNIVPFLQYREILVENRLSQPTLWRPRYGWPSWNFAECFLALENYSPGGVVRRSLRDPTFSRFCAIPACDGWTDGQTHDNSIYDASITSSHQNSPASAW